MDDTDDRWWGLIVEKGSLTLLVEHGNTLSGERFARAWTPATTAFFLHHGRLFPEASASTTQERIADEEPVIIGEQLVLL